MRPRRISDTNESVLGSIHGILTQGRLEEGMWRLDFSQAATLDLPVLILQDRSDDFPDSERVTRISLEDVGALPALEAPKEVTTHLLPWTRTTVPS